MPSALSASSTGAIRAISVSDETGAASGLLDAGPRSITSAPSAISLRACAMAASGARYRPPSEKLSEVMLTMPKMMSDLFMGRSEEHTSELQSRPHLVCRLLLEKKKKEDT